MLWSCPLKPGRRSFNFYCSAARVRGPKKQAWKVISVILRYVEDAGGQLRVIHASVSRYADPHMLFFVSDVVHLLERPF